MTETELIFGDKDFGLEMSKVAETRQATQQELADMREVLATPETEHPTVVRDAESRKEAVEKLVSLFGEHDDEALLGICRTVYDTGRALEASGVPESEVVAGVYGQVSEATFMYQLLRTTPWGYRLGQAKSALQAEEREAGKAKTAEAMKINIEFKPDVATARLSVLPQSVAIQQLYVNTKSVELSGGHSVDSELGEIYSLHDPIFAHTEEPWDEAALDRIIIQEAPQNLEEEEFMRLWKARSAMTMLAYRFLWASNLPRDLQSKFSTQQKPDSEYQLFRGSAHLTTFEFDEAIGALTHWAKANPDKNTPFKFDEHMAQGVANVCERLNELRDFYNTNAGSLLNGEDRIRYQGRLILFTSLAYSFGTPQEEESMQALYDQSWNV